VKLELVPSSATAQTNAQDDLLLRTAPANRQVCRSSNRYKLLRNYSAVIYDPQLAELIWVCACKPWDGANTATGGVFVFAAFWREYGIHWMLVLAIARGRQGVASTTDWPHTPP
jgi:hypothetical protein